MSKPIAPSPVLKVAVLPVRVFPYELSRKKPKLLDVAVLLVRVFP